ncbi:MAG TPA: type II toxin-antitoxin system VapC family toxin [Terriglobales bacterium]|nr:type II toxin-antitoxin system VapC family toxin [Terriglobales bacterium]
MTFVLDASAVLRFLDNEPGALEVERLIKDAAIGAHDLLMSAANWGEVFYIVLKAHGVVSAENIENRFQSLPINVLSVDPIVAREAAEFRFRFKVPFADSFAGALALRNNATLITADNDFRVVGNALKVSFLPNKSKGRTP